MSERDPSQTSGFLSGVFSFVSRELEGFITNATGGTLSDVGETQARDLLNLCTVLIKFGV